MNISTLFDGAKAHLLEMGDYPPTLWVEFTDAGRQPHLGLYTFTEFGAGTALEKQKQFFAHGADFGCEHGRVDISSLVLIGEAWVSHVKNGEYQTFKQRYGCPEHDPQRREYLLASIVTLEPQASGKPALKHRFERAEIVRPAQGVIDLVPEPAGEDGQRKMSMTLPMYWLAGCMFETRLSEQERAYVAGMLEKGKQA